MVHANYHPYAANQQMQRRYKYFTPLPETHCTQQSMQVLRLTGSVSPTLLTRLQSGSNLGSISVKSSNLAEQNTLHVPFLNANLNPFEESELTQAIRPSSAVIQFSRQNGSPVLGEITAHHFLTEIEYLLTMVSEKVARLGITLTEHVQHLFIEAKNLVARALHAVANMFINIYEHIISAVQGVWNAFKNVLHSLDSQFASISPFLLIACASGALFWGTVLFGILL